MSGGGLAAPAASRWVLITRPGLDDRTCAVIEARGYLPVVAPFLTIRRLPLRMPRAAQAILVTSGNALASLPLVPLAVLAVGDATAERARAQGFTDVSSAAGDAAALARLAARLADPGGAPLLLASGSGQGHALAADLRARGFRVIRRVCYAARPVARFPGVASEMLQSGHLHAVLFLSAETAAAFVRLMPPGLSDTLRTVAALAIGTSTAETLETLPWLRVCRARTPTLDDVLAQL